MNYKQFLKRIVLNDDKNVGTFKCSCHKFPNLRKGDKRVLIKANDIPHACKELRSILLLNMKNPVMIDKSLHNKMTQDAFQFFFNKLNIVLNDDELQRLSSYNQLLVKFCPQPEIDRRTRRE